MQVLEKAHEVGRFSVSTAPDVSYKEMSGHCEALLMGKQQKMSNLISTQQKQVSLMNFSSQNHDDEAKKMITHCYDVSFHGPFPCSSKLQSTCIHMHGIYSFTHIFTYYATHLGL